MFRAISLPAVAVILSLVADRQNAVCNLFADCHKRRANDLRGIQGFDANGG